MHLHLYQRRVALIHTYTTHTVHKTTKPKAWRDIDKKYSIDSRYSIFENCRHTQDFSFTEPLYEEIKFEDCTLLLLDKSVRIYRSSINIFCAIAKTFKSYRIYTSQAITVLTRFGTL